MNCAKHVHSFDCEQIQTFTSVLALAERARERVDQTAADTVTAIAGCRINRPGYCLCKVCNKFISRAHDHITVMTSSFVFCFDKTKAINVRNVYTNTQPQHNDGRKESWGMSKNRTRIAPNSTEAKEEMKKVSGDTRDREREREKEKENEK